MEAAEGEDSIRSRTSDSSRSVYKQRNLGKASTLRVVDSSRRVFWGSDYSVDGQEMNEKLRTPEKMRDWAYDNAGTLIFLSVMFFITWVITVVASFV